MNRLRCNCRFIGSVLAGAFRRVLDGRVDAASETYVPAVSSGKTLAQLGWTGTVIPLPAATNPPMGAPNHCTHSRFLGYIWGDAWIRGVIADVSPGDRLPFLVLALAGERCHVSSASP